MKANIHPNYIEDVKVVCSCGNTFVTGSTKQNIRVDLCYSCHPFYTGTQKLVDTEGKVERFDRLRQIAAKRQQETSAKKEAVKIEEKARAERPNSLADMVAAIRKQQKS